MIKIYDLLQECKVEKDVEEKFKRVLGQYFPKAEISSPYRTDGLLEDGDLKLLMEYKFDCDFTKRLQVIDLLIQIIYYVKQFENHGDEIPTVLFGGDRDECFCLHSNDIIKYLDEDIDWTIAPSDAPSKNPELAKKISDDQNITPYIFSINDNGFDFKFVVDKINQLHMMNPQKVRITELNIGRFFSYFVERVIKLNKKYSSEDLVAIFLGCLIDPINNYLHPNKNNVMIVMNQEVMVDKVVYNSFFNHFSTNYTIDEKQKLTSICDRLIEDEDRRLNGEYYTPTDVTNLSHKMIEEQVGMNWKDEVVWDTCWGTGNLTRDYNFKKLYTSTLNFGDFNIAKQYNPEAVKFQYDFLNDDVTTEGILPINRIKLPHGLTSEFEKNSKIIIFMNPPYTALNNLNGKNTKSEFKKSLTAENLKRLKLSGSSGGGISGTRLFLFESCQKIINNRLDGSIIASYMSTNDLTKGEIFELRKYMYTSGFDFKCGFCVQASKFADVKSNWGISFVIYEYNLNNKNRSLSGFNDSYQLNCVDLKNNIRFPITYQGIPELIVNWPKRLVVNKETELKLSLSSAIKAEREELKKIPVNSLGYLSRVKSTNWSIWSSIGTNSGTPIIVENFKECCAIFCAGKYSTNNWFDEAKELLIPNINHPDYNKWNNDSIIYSLFSEQSSLRKMPNKGVWTNIKKGIINKGLSDIKNEFFWMSNEEMQILSSSTETGFDELYFDAQGDSDRFVYNKIKEIYEDPNQEFSPDANAVLNKAVDLVRETFKYRQQLHEEYPEWHLNAWDAGWYQIKKILNLYFKDELKEFNALYKAFEDRMRAGVYKFGFLK